MAFRCQSRASQAMALWRKHLSRAHLLPRAAAMSTSTFSMDDFPPPSAPLPRPRSFYSNKRSSLSRRLAAREMPDELADFHGLANSTFPEVLERLDRLDNIGLKPHPGTYAALLQSAGNRVTLENGKLVADHIVRYKFDSDKALVGLILQMYRRCKCVEGAREWFDKMEVNNEKKNLYMWNCMLGTYCQHGRRAEALEFFELMKKERMATEKEAYLALAAVVSGKENTRDGRWVHAHIVKSPYKWDSEVGIELVRMYGRCADVPNARKMFRILSDRNLGAWHAMKSALARNGYHEEAANMFDVMLEHDEVPDSAVMSGVILACANGGFFLNGMKIHARLPKQPLESDKKVLTSLINLYGKCGYLQEAQRIFDEIKEKDVIVWNTLLKVYAEQGHPKKVLEVLEKMTSQGLTPNRVTLICGLSACASLADLSEGNTIRSQVSSIGLDSDPGVATALIHMFGKCGSIEEAREVFDKLTERGASVWNAMLVAYAQNGRLEEALKLFEQMQNDGLVPDCSTHTSIVSACGQSSPELAYALFEKLPEKGLTAFNTMIATYVQHGQGTQALGLFNQMKQTEVIPDRETFLNILSACDNPSALTELKNIHLSLSQSGLESDSDICSALLKAYGKCGNVEEARGFFDGSSARTLNLWNSIIAVYASNGKSKEAFELYSELQKSGLVPDEATFINVLSACFTLDEGKQVYEVIVQHGLESDIDVADAAVRMYGRLRDLDGAKRAFDSALKPNTVLLASSIAAHAQNGQEQEALDLHKKLQGEGMLSDKVSYSDILTAFNCDVLAEEKRYQLLSINKRCGILPAAQHFSALKDLLGTSGQLNELEDLVYHVPYVPPNITYSKLTEENKFSFNFHYGFST